MILPSMQFTITSSITSKLGTSHTYKTFSLVIFLNPVYVAYKLFMAYLISPSVVNNKVSNP